MPEPQLILRNPDLSRLPPLKIPDGFSLHCHREGEEQNWEDLIEEAFGGRYSFDRFIRNGGGYRPEYVLYVEKDGRDIATATAVESSRFPGEGWLRMVGTRPCARGQGAGRLVLTACLHSLLDRGYRSALLSTDDHRIPAVGLYLSLGFEPYFTDPGHPARWEKVMEILKNR